MQQDIPAIKFTVSSGWHQLDDLDLRISLNETNRLLATSTADASALTSSLSRVPPTEK